MKENKRKCMKCGKSPGDDHETTLYRFPKPSSLNVERCQLWAKCCCPDESWLSVRFHQQLYSEHRMLCHRHFDKQAFFDYSLKKLLRNAVPSWQGRGEESEVLDDATRSNVPGPSEPWEASRAPCGAPDAKRPRTDCAPEETDATEGTDVIDSTDVTGKPEECSTTEFCRICLASEGMFYAMEGNEKLCSLYDTLTGLEPAGGSLPSLVCEGCAQSLLDLGRLRELARRSRDVMLRVADTHQQVTLEAIRSVEESQTVLEEHLDMDCFDNDHLSQEEIVTLTDDDTGENSENINTGSGIVKHSAKVKGTKVVRIGTNHDGVSTNDNKKHFVLTDQKYIVSDRTKSVCPQADRVSVNCDRLQAGRTEDQCDDTGIADDVEVKEETLEEDEAREFYLVV